MVRATGVLLVIVIVIVFDLSITITIKIKKKHPNIPTFIRLAFVYIAAHDEGRNRRNSIGDRNLA
jgi:hypothetical protein